MLDIVPDSVSKNFGRHEVFDEVSLNVKGKGCLGYIGPNRARKTTSVKMLASLITPDSGTAIHRRRELREG